VDYQIQVYVQVMQRGKITLPAQVRRLLDLKDGDWLQLTAQRGRIEAIPLGTTVFEEAIG